MAHVTLTCTLIGQQCGLPEDLSAPILNMTDPTLAVINDTKTTIPLFVAKRRAWFSLVPMTPLRSQRREPKPEKLQQAQENICKVVCT